MPTGIARPDRKGGEALPESVRAQREVNEAAKEKAKEKLEEQLSKAEEQLLKEHANHLRTLKLSKDYPSADNYSIEIRLPSGKKCPLPVGSEIIETWTSVRSNIAEKVDEDDPRKNLLADFKDARANGKVKWKNKTNLAMELFMEQGYFDWMLQAWCKKDRRTRFNQGSTTPIKIKRRILHG